MKKSALPLMIAAILPLALAEDLTTTDGKTYTEVKITKVEPDGLRIMHASGTAKVPFEKLSDEIQKKHGYDPFNAYNHEQAEKAKQAAIDKAEADRARAVQASRDKAKKQAEEDKRRQGEIDMAKSWGCMMQFSQNAESAVVANGVAGAGGFFAQAKTTGLVAILAKGTPAKVPVMKGKIKVGERDGWVYSRTWTPAYIDGSPVTVVIDSGKLRLDGEKLLYPIGQARFVDLDGNKKTLPRFTEELEAAVKFYAKNGRPGSCDTVITDFSEPASD